MDDDLEIISGDDYMLYVVIVVVIIGFGYLVYRNQVPITDKMTELYDSANLKINEFLGRTWLQMNMEGDAIKVTK